MTAEKADSSVAMLQRVQARLDFERFYGVARELHDMAACTTGSEAADERQGQVLCRDAEGQTARYGNAHRPGLANAQRPGGECMLGFRRANSPGERPECTLRAGVAVGTNQGQPGEYYATLGRYHVHDALCRVAQVEQAYAGGLCSVARGGDELHAARHQRRVGSAGSRVDHMVHGGKHLCRVEDIAAALGDAPKGDATRTFVQQNAVDRDQIGGHIESRNAMLGPDFFE